MVPASAQSRSDRQATAASLPSSWLMQLSAQPEPVHLLAKKCDSSSIIVRSGEGRRIQSQHLQHLSRQQRVLLYNVWAHGLIFQV
mmetsp:Transcript_59420/g.117765  ORF Transcript_59420/g.117765 Transcript_59420/m.117765 type:complete len:85 (-) Transcript_59420:88-342(-)